MLGPRPSHVPSPRLELPEGPAEKQPQHFGCPPRPPGHGDPQTVEDEAEMPHKQLSLAQGEPPLWKDPDLSAKQAATAPLASVLRLLQRLRGWETGRAAVAMK